MTRMKDGIIQKYTIEISDTAGPNISSSAYEQCCWALGLQVLRLVRLMRLSLPEPLPPYLHCRHPALLSGFSFSLRTSYANRISETGVYLEGISFAMQKKSIPLSRSNQHTCSCNVEALK